MATIQELEDGLRKAHAAGNTEHARRFADAIRKQRTQQGGDPGAAYDRAASRAYAGTGTDQYGRKAAPARVEPAPKSRTIGDRYDSYISGVGKSMRDTGVGLKQLLSEGLEDRVDAVWNVMGRPGADKGDPIGELRQYNERSRQEEARLRASLPGMAEDPEFAFGNVVGTLGQLFTPGAALRGTAAGRAALPATIKGNTLQGMALGTVQPVAEQGERAVNQAVGGLAGLAGAAVPKALGAGYSALSRLLGGQTLTGAERRAAMAIQEIASNPGALSTPAPSAVPGVTRSLAQETTDPGVIALERVQRGRNPQAFSGNDTNNNSARMAVLQRIAGSDGDMAAAEAARGSAGASARQEAMQAGPVDVSKTIQVLDDAIAGQQGRPDIQNALRSVRSLLARDVEGAPGLTTTIPEDRIGVLDNVRMTMGDMLSGKWSQDTNKALAGSRELIGVRDSLNSEIGAQVPAFTEYLNAYRSMSQPINRMQVGRQLIDRSTAANPADAVGTPLLQAARYGNAFSDLDAIAASATGFKKARADQILGADDFAALKAIDDDMTRIAIANRSPQVGSQTDANKYVGDQMADEVIQGVLKDVPFARIFANRASEQTQQKLAYLLANPAEYRRVAAALPTKQRELLSKALLQLSARPAAAAPALAE